MKSIIVRPLYVDMVSDYLAAAFLTHVVSQFHFQNRKNLYCDCGIYWYVCNYDEFWSSIRLTARQSRRACDICRDLGLIKTKIIRVGTTNRLAIHLDSGNFLRLLTAEKRRQSKRDSGFYRSANPQIGYIYLLRSEYGTKIGKTRRLKSRRRSFAVDLPFDCEITHLWMVPDYSASELAAHELMRPRHLRGEWFSLSGGDINNLDAFLTEHYGASSCNPKEN